MEETTVVLPLMMVLLGYTGLKAEQINPNNSYQDKEEQSTVNTSDGTDV